MIWFYLDELNFLRFNLCKLIYTETVEDFLIRLVD